MVTEITTLSGIGEAFALMGGNFSFGFVVGVLVLVLLWRPQRTETRKPEWCQCAKCGKWHVRP